MYVDLLNLDSFHFATETPYDSVALPFHFGTFVTFRSKNRYKRQIDDATFYTFNRSYYLSDCKERFDFDELKLLNRSYTYTFLVTKGKIILFTIQDENKDYISPFDSRWFVPDFCTFKPTIMKKANSTKSIKFAIETPGILKVNDSACWFLLLYKDKQLYQLNVYTKEICDTFKIRNISKEVDRCLFIARFKQQNTDLFEKRFYTKTELKIFQEKFDHAKYKFRKDLHQKSKKRWVNFPEKVYNIIKLGDLFMKRTCHQNNKEFFEKIWKESLDRLYQCTIGWRIKALHEFYDYYFYK